MYPANQTGNVTIENNFGMPATQENLKVINSLASVDYNVDVLRQASDIVPRDTMLQIDNTILRVLQEELVFTGLVESSGLTYNLPNPLAKTSIRWQRTGDSGPATMSMHVTTQEQSDRTVLDEASLPLPLWHRHINIDSRQLAQDQEAGFSHVNDQIAWSARAIAQGIEYSNFHGARPGGSNVEVPGLLTFPDRNTYMLDKTSSSFNKPWSEATGQEILDSIAAMIEMLQTTGSGMGQVGFNGPYWLVIPHTLLTKLNQEFYRSTNVTTVAGPTILNRIQSDPQIRAIVPTPVLNKRTIRWGTGPGFESNTNGEDILLIQPNNTVFDLINGFDPVLLNWSAHGGLEQNWKVMAMKVPRPRSNYYGHCGILHAHI